MIIPFCSQFMNKKFRILHFKTHLKAHHNFDEQKRIQKEFQINLEYLCSRFPEH